jgi:hypothetical protein
MKHHSVSPEKKNLRARHGGFKHNKTKGGSIQPALIHHRGVASAERSGP